MNTRVLKALSDEVRIEIMLFLFRTKIKDLTCGFHLIDRKVFDIIPYTELTSEGFFVFSEIHLLAEKAGLNVNEIPNYFPKREKGKSKINIGISAEFAKDALLYLIKRRS